MSAAKTSASIRWGADGLVPVVTVDAGSGDVLMVASMNAEALALTRETGTVHYWSRSRGTLWRKGETSGHEQRLVEIRVNCNRDSLLLRVEQQGAVCHDGYPTCYYRRLEPDGSLPVVRERAFDPTEVYGERDDATNGVFQAVAALAGPALVDAWYGAYLALRDQDFAAVSGTSRLLRDPADNVSVRLADELEELAGVVDGSHRHRSFADDVALEATQCLYWAALVAAREKMRLEQVLALLSHASKRDMSSGAAAAAPVRNCARLVRMDGSASRHLGGAAAAVLAVARSAGFTRDELLRRDLMEMLTRPYLAAYFDRALRP